MKSITEKIADKIYDETEELGERITYQRCLEIAEEINDLVKEEYVKAIEEYK